MKTCLTTITFTLLVATLMSTTPVLADPLPPTCPAGSQGREMPTATNKLRNSGYSYLRCILGDDVNKPTLYLVKDGVIEQAYSGTSPEGGYIAGNLGNGPAITLMGMVDVMFYAVPTAESLALAHATPDSAGEIELEYRVMSIQALPDGGPIFSPKLKFIMVDLGVSVKLKTEAEFPGTYQDAFTGLWFVPLVLLDSDLPQRSVTTTAIFWAKNRILAFQYQFSPEKMTLVWNLEKLPGLIAARVLPGTTHGALGFANHELALFDGNTLTTVAKSEIPLTDSQKYSWPDFSYFREAKSSEPWLFVGAPERTIYFRHRTTQAGSFEMFQQKY